jgi:hypothetical protein
MWTTSRFGLTIANLKPDVISSIIIFRNISVIITDQNWDAFVVEFPALFNEIFKKCAEHINLKLMVHYKVQKVAAADKTKTSKDNLQTLSVKSHDSELSRDFAATFSNMPLSDVELEVEGKILKAHKIILWSNCVLNSISVDVF